MTSLTDQRIMERRNILLTGKTGDGKSSAGNTILNKDVFTPKATASSATDEPVTGCGLVHGREITVINTPGFFDTDKEDVKTKSEIIKALMDTKLHAIVFVLRVGKFTKHENEVVEKFLNLMKDERVLKHTAILFTFGEQLEGQTLKEFIKSNSKLQELIEKCEGRCHVIDNKYWNDCHSGEKSNRVQVNNLLDTVDKMVQKNGCFTSELLQALDVMVQEEMKINKDNLPPDEKREKAKEIVCNKILEKVAGATTGAVIGAFLGLFVSGVVVFTLLKALKSLLKESRDSKASTEAVAAVICAGAAGAERTVIAVSVVGTAALTGATVGAITGWKAAEEADSVYDAMTNSAKVNYENGKAVVEKIHELAFLVVSNKM